MTIQVVSLKDVTSLMLLELLMVVGLGLTSMVYNMMVLLTEELMVLQVQYCLH